MTNFLTIIKRILFLLMVLPHLCRAGVQNNCSEFFSGHSLEENWPPADWRSYLSNISKTIKPQQPYGLVPRRRIDTPAEDSRLYTEGLMSTMEQEFHLDPDLRQEFESAQSDYGFEGSLTLRGGPYLIRSHRLQRQFEVFDLPRRHEFTDQTSYRASLLKYLDRIENVVRQGKKYPEYQDIFNANNFKFETGDRKAAERGEFMGKKIIQWHSRQEVKTLAWPIEKIADTSFARYFVQRETEFGDLVVTKLSTVIVGSSGDQSSDELQLDNNPNSSDITQGQQLQKRMVIDLISEIYPDYIKRRHWTKDFIESDFREVLDTINTTDYVVVRRKSKDGSPRKLVAALGMNRASYGVAQTYNPVTKVWEEFVGSFGSTYYDSNAKKSGVQPARSAPLKEGPVQLLKTEAYMGPNYRMERPSYTEAIHIDDTGPRYVNGEFIGKSPVYAKAGEIFEPVKFFMSRDNEDRLAALTIAYAETFDFILPYGRSSFVAAKGSALYTMNPKAEGTRLYSKRGMHVIPELPGLRQDGIEWFAFKETLRDYIYDFHHYADEETKRNPLFTDKIKILRESTGRILNILESK